MTEYETLKVSYHGRVASLVLNRPDKRNSLNAAFWKELPQAVGQIDAEAYARVIVVSSTGPHFTSGIDLSMLSSENPASVFAPAENSFDSATLPGPMIYERILLMQRAISGLEKSRIPIIAAIQGGCIGGGVDLITACCIRYASADAYFTIHEINIGVTADVGTLPRILKLIPEGVARELAYTGRKMSADEALSVGLINRIFPNHHALLAGAMEIAGEIAGKAPLALYGVKQMANYARDHTIADSLDYVALWNASFLAADEIAEAMKAKAENREGRFAGLPRHPKVAPGSG